VKRKTTRRTYRLRNWSQYNAALEKRGSLTLWVSEEALSGWHEDARTGKRGAPRTYSDTAILSMAWLSAVYRLALRATQGLLVSVLKLLRVELPVPDYTTLCRRRRRLAVSLPRRAKGAPLHVVVDATGVKVYEEGEWKVRRHGSSKRRTWRKLHIGVDESSGEIVAAAATTNDLSDGQLLPELLDQIDEDIAQVSGDGAYDKRDCYKAISERKAQAAIPPRRGARIWPAYRQAGKHGNSNEPPLARDEHLRRIRRIGRAAWKQEIGYHRRSLAETAIFRVKTIFGDRVRSRTFEGQGAEMLIRCAALNRMTHLGMPDSYAP
jgi:IS5 family transposase